MNTRSIPDALDAITVTVPVRITRSAICDCVRDAAPAIGHWARGVNAIGEDRWVIIEERYAEPDGLRDVQHVITSLDIARAIANVMTGNIAADDYTLANIQEGVCGDGWSADTADVIMQVAALGEIAYG